MMGQDKFGYLEVDGPEATTHYTSDKLRDLVMVIIAWLTTMECTLLLQTGTMMPLAITVQAPTQAVDGGIITATIQP